MTPSLYALSLMYSSMSPTDPSFQPCDPDVVAASLAATHFVEGAASTSVHVQWDTDGYRSDEQANVTRSARCMSEAHVAYADLAARATRLSSRGVTGSLEYVSSAGTVDVGYALFRATAMEGTTTPSAKSLTVVFDDGKPVAITNVALTATGRLQARYDVQVFPVGS